MNIKRSFLSALFASAAIGLFVTNCTVKEDNSDECDKGDKDSGCACPGGLTGYQVCDSDGVFGECVCPDDNSGGGTKNTSGSGNSSGGDDTDTGGKTNNGGTGATTSYAGSGDGGSPEATGGTGEGGGPAIDPADFVDCDDCLDKLCKKEFDACFADTQCFSETGDGTGQYERISLCIETERENGVVKRDAVRGCGVTMGVSPNADLAADWAPEGMVPATTNLINCLATSSSETPSNEWAENNDENFPVVNNMVAPKAWPEDSCAKLACTSKSTD